MKSLFSKFFKKKSKFTCPDCGEVHEGWPALTYSSPTYYHVASEEVKSKSFLSEDLCVVNDVGETHYFIRVTLVMKVNDSEEDLYYGLWTSLSEKSFKDYQANFDNPDHIITYFGWLSSSLPDYDNSVSIGLQVNTRPGTQRPEIVPYSDQEYQFVLDYYNGISAHEAQKRVDEMFETVQKREEDESKK